MPEITPFRFDTDGTQALESLIMVMDQVPILLDAFREADLDTTELEDKYNEYNDLIRRVYAEYKEQ